MTKKTEQIVVRLPSELRRRAEKAASEAGEGLSAFIRDAIYLYAHFSHPAFMQTVRRLSEMYGVGDSLAIENVVIHYVAEKIAREQVLGEETDTPPEFQKGEKGIVRGHELLEKLIIEFARKFEAEKE
jgi:hypothetical protein